MKKSNKHTESGESNVQDSKTEPIEGGGDVLELMFKYTGVKGVVDRVSKVLGFDCGCDERREWLNRILPNKKKFKTARCLNEDQFNWLSDFFSQKKTKISAIDQRKLAEIHSHLFHHRLHIPCSTCGNAWKNYLNDIKTIFDAYQKN